jgi:hypothetical protein
MRTFLTVMVTLAILPQAVGAPARRDDERAVLDAVQRLFDAFAARDAAATSALLVDEGSFVAIVTREDGGVAYTVTPHTRIVEQVGADSEPWYERIWDARVEVHGPLAMVWAPYDFRRGETFSHCGVDALTLIRTADGWKLVSAVYTVEREGCET